MSAPSPAAVLLGYEHIEFWLLQLEKMQGCKWVNERDERYWQPGARIDIEILREQVLDEDELPKRFNVTIR